jgi:hypothetical protein
MGEFTSPTLLQLENALDLCSHITTAVVTVDTWDLDRLPACEHCRTERIERLQRLNRSGSAQPRIACRTCESA